MRMKALFTGRLYDMAKEYLVVSLALFITLLLVCAAYARNKVWISDTVLWEDAVSKSPRKARCHHYLGTAYAKQGLIDLAIGQLQTTIRLTPYSALSHNNLGNLYAEQGRYADAIHEYKMALALKPDDKDIQNNLGIAYKELDQLRQ
jgi:tetratricopeptide (TPR) repeat protein